MIFDRQNNKNDASNAILEVLAVVFNLLFTWLYLKNSDWCFLFGILGPICLGILCSRKMLFAEVGLQLIYIASAVFGFLQIGGSWNPITLELQHHLISVGLGFVVVLGLGIILQKKTKAVLPFVDSFTTVFGVIATIMMMFFIREAFLYFIVINFVSIIMYSLRKMYLGAFMFLVYLLMSIDGFFQLDWFS